MPLPFTALAQFIADRLSRYESTPAPRLATAAETGAYGERVAAAYLRRHGYKVLVRNFSTTRGEIDLVCRHGNTLVFVEVKTRASVDIVPPVEAIDERKAEALHSTARHYLELLERDDIAHRFDAVEVELHEGKIPACKLLQNIFA